MASAKTIVLITGIFYLTSPKETLGLINEKGLTQALGTKLPLFLPPRPTFIFLSVRVPLRKAKMPYLLCKPQIPRALSLHYYLM
jgi:hypothetical protein